mmetsp:Transcript_45023/g.119122  ORF Transcript_45023/g.119122 Transcript_45023/m.119122 type:complete len:336 (+) Transcript_45023:1687-2694(+)
MSSRSSACSAPVASHAESRPCSASNLDRTSTKLASCQAPAWPRDRSRRSKRCEASSLKELHALVKSLSCGFSPLAALASQPETRACIVSNLSWTSDRAPSCRASKSARALSKRMTRSSASQPATRSSTRPRRPSSSSARALSTSAEAPVPPRRSSTCASKSERRTDNCSNCARSSSWIASCLLSKFVRALSWAARRSSASSLDAQHASASSSSLARSPPSALRSSISWALFANMPPNISPRLASFSSRENWRLSRELWRGSHEEESCAKVLWELRRFATAFHNSPNAACCSSTAATRSRRCCIVALAASRARALPSELAPRTLSRKSRRSLSKLC